METSLCHFLEEKVRAWGCKLYKHTIEMDTEAGPRSPVCSYTSVVVRIYQKQMMTSSSLQQ